MIYGVSSMTDPLKKVAVMKPSFSLKNADPSKWNYGPKFNPEKIDKIQISRWKAFGPRHIGAIKKNCPKKLWSCRRKQRQALLQWAYNPFF